MIRKENRKCKLFRDGELLDDNVTLIWDDFEESTQYSKFVTGSGEIRTSYPSLIVGRIIDEKSDPGSLRYELVFDQPITANKNKIPISFRTATGDKAIFETKFSLLKKD